MTENMNKIKDSNKELKQKLNEKQDNISKLEKLLKDLVKMEEPKKINSRRGINLKRRTKIRSLKKNYMKTKINEKINVKQELNQMINNEIVSEKEKECFEEVYHTQKEKNSVTHEIIQGSKIEPATKVSLISNIHKETCLHAQNDLKNSKLVKKENIKIPQESNIKIENYNRKYFRKEDGKPKWHILNLKKSINSNISKISPKERKVPNHEKADSYIKKLTETHGFAIKMEDKVLLFNKDPRLRINLGSQIRKSNKFGCLRNDILYENKIFREI